MFYITKRLFFIALSFILNGCGEIISTLDYSSIKGADLSWASKQNISSSNIASYSVSGKCVPQFNDVTISVGIPVLASTILPCTNGLFNGVMDLSAAGLAEGATEVSATQVSLTSSALVQVLVDTIIPFAVTIIAPANGSSTSTASISVTGTCDTGNTINISGDVVGSPLTTICMASSFSRSVNLILGNGPKVINATQTDLVGNISPAATSNINLGILPLAPTVTSPANGMLTNLTTQNITGACETGATVNIMGDVLGAPVLVVCVASSYNQSVTLTALNGIKNYSVSQTNGAGASPTTNRTLNLDTTAPSAPTITSPVNGVTTGTTAQTIIGACETGAIVNISGAIVGSPVTASCVASAYSLAVTLIAGDGAKAISGTQTDPAGNLSAASNISITLDQTAPLTPTISSPTNGSVTNSTMQTIIGACETGATVNISGAIIGSPLTASCVASSYSRAVTLTAGDGLKAISATQTDVANNTSAATNISINLDTVAPAAITITSPSNGSFVNTTSIVITGACTSGLPVDLSGNFTPSPVSVGCVASSYSRAVTLTAGDGVKNISGTQTDLAGNTSAATNISITLDTAAPSAPTITSPLNGSFTNSTAQTIIGACETGATVSISGAILGSPLTASCVASAYSRAVTLTAANGAKALSATQTDVANNTSTAANISITFDTTAPSAPTITSPANGSFSNTTAQTVVGTCETGSTVNLSGAFTGSPLTAACAASAYSRAITLTGADGSKAISATQTDLALNTSTAINISITLDRANPAPPTIVSPVNGITTTSASQTVSGACETGTTLEIWGNLVGSPLFTTCTASSYSLGVTLTAAFGAKTINVHQTDQANNTSTPVAVTINYTNLNVTYPASFTGPKYTPLNFPAAGIARTLISGTPTGYSIAPALPTGLSINAISGLIAGSPTISDDAGKTYTITITDGSATITRNIFIRIAIPDYTWMGTAGDGLWTTAANWKAAAVPPPTAFTYFDDECLVSGFCNVGINANVQVQRVYMKPTYTGMITQNAGRTFQVGNRDSNGGASNTWGKWQMDAGTFLGGNAALTAERINIQGGTFTSTSGTLRLGSVYTWKDFDAGGPTWDWQGLKDGGLTLSSTATFNHNSGVVFINSVSSTSGYGVFAFWLDQPLNIRNLIFENKTTGGPAGHDNRHNSADGYIYGTSKIINLSETLEWRDGNLMFGEIRYQGLNAIFRCDAIIGSNNCSDLVRGSNKFSEPGFLPMPGVQVHTYLRFNRNDGLSQTYTFDDGAAAPGFIVDNPNGLNPVPTNPPIGYFRLGKLQMDQGVFTAPRHLSFGDGTNTYYAGGTASLGIDMNGGGFNHNNGTVSFKAVTDYDDSRSAISIRAISAITFNIVEVDIFGDYDLDGPNDFYHVYIYPGSVVNVLGNLDIRNGRFDSGFPGATLNVSGNLNFYCANFALKNCYNTNYYLDINLFGSVDSTLSFEAGGQGFLGSRTNLTINKTLQTNRVTLIGNGGLTSSNTGSPRFITTKGVFDIGIYSFTHASNLVNNGAVQCSVGTGYFQYLGALSGTPQPGNQPLCYGP